MRAFTFTALLALAGTCTAAAPGVQAGDAGSGDARAGERLYRDGVTAAGSPVEAVLQGDVTVRGAGFACAGCHRRSGMGSSEGGVYVPPITARRLFARREMNRALRNERFKELFTETQPAAFWSDVRMPRARPAYDAVTLRRAVVDGVDAAGRPLAPIMPRYRLSPTDAANLTAYLQELSAGADPGVDADSIKLATVVSADADPRLRAAFVDTARAYVAWMNRDTANDLARGDFSPYYRTEFKAAYRRWDLAVWELEGPGETWAAQLAARYRREPVFAMVSGLVPGDYAPVARFCREQRLPCLFPNTPLPDTAEGGAGYSLYFSRGLELEGRVLGGWIAGQPQQAVASVVQLHVAGRRGRVPAAALAGELARLRPDLPLRTTAVVADEFADTLRDMSQEAAGRILVIWPGRSAGAAVAALNDTAKATATGGRIVLASAALEAVRAGLSDELAPALRVVSPYADDLAAHPRRFRVRAWMRSRRLAIVDWHMQAQTFYAFSVLQYGLEHLLTDFHREYLLEIIEHEAENDLNPGIYPALALGPGQRFASKGAHLVRLHEDRRRGFVADGAWIVPR